MKKFIYIPDFLAIVAGLLRGESFEGRLFIDQDTHVLTLKLWKRKAPKNSNYSKVSDTDYGSLWKSEKHLLWREKYPLSMGMGSMLTAMEAVRCVKDNLKTKDNVWEVNTEKEYHETTKA